MPTSRYFPETFDVEFVGLVFHETTDPNRAVAEFRSVGRGSCWPVGPGTCVTRPWREGMVECVPMSLVSLCPHCAHPLEPFVATSRTGAQVELARCAQCAGFWGAAGRIQDTFGEPARHQLVGGETQRSCVECRILMTPARLPSGATVEVCSACRGMFLDAGELAPLGVRETPPPAARPPPPRAPPPPPRRAEPAHTPGQPHSVEDHRELPVLVVEEESVEPPAPGTFRCVECGQARPLREGQALRDGLACRACMKARVEG